MTQRRWWWCVAQLTTVMVATDLQNLGATADPPDASLGELLTLYRAHELPLPPERARLVHSRVGLENR